MKLLLNIIGAGHLGKTIGYLLVKHQLVNIGFIVNRSAASTSEAIKFFGEGNYCPTVEQLPAADITLITTSDDLILGMSEKLSNSQFLKKGSIVLHCSGSLTSDALIAIKQKGCYVGSVHPMRSFAKPELSVKQYDGTYCAIEGDAQALATMRYLFDSIGSTTYEIEKEKKCLYHAAGVFASNYLVTLAHQALSCMKEAAVDNEMAMHVVTNIMKGTIANLEKTLSPLQALTGPIKRGDLLTIKKHIENLPTAEQRNLYAVLGKATMDLTDHNEITKNKILDAFTLSER
ncbi:MAG: DUF2520 domain-containing protein [Legionella sp.]|nr:DUF2520 domain-containing protein [Legionella sp.]